MQKSNNVEQAEGVVQDGEASPSASNPVPKEVRQRLAVLLQHLAGKSAESRAKMTHCSGRRGPQCSTCDHKHDDGSCSTDIEDLGQCNHGLSHSGDYGDGEEAWLFHPSRFVETQKPLLQASTLPRECYSSGKWFQREMERVFAPSWTLLGREDEIPEPGNYLAEDTEWGGPVAVCRGEEGELHAFANVCCHRGAKILQGEKGCGSKLGLVCPYHAWTYDLDGKLLWAPGMGESQNFEEDDVRLTPIRVETFHGFIFVTVAKDAPSLIDSLGDLPRHLGEWFGDSGVASDCVVVERREYMVPCNWKFVMENTCETYHTSVVHKNSLGPMKASPLPPHVGDWDAVVVPTTRSVVPLPTDFVGEPEPLPAFAKRSAFVNLFPSLQINVTWDCLWWMRMTPLGPEQTRINMGFCFPKGTTTLPKFQTVLPEYLKRWHIAVTEDNAISCNQQRGVRSMFRVPGRFCQLEFGTHNFNNWLVSRMIDGARKWDAGQRVYVGKEVWSNDDRKLLDLVDKSGVNDNI